MSPQLYFLRAICLSGISIIAGCATHSAPDSDTANRVAAEQYYDQYYGNPPHTGRTIGQGRHPSRAAGQQTTMAGKSAAGRMVVNPAAPRTYVVKKGDTMWGIARKYLHTPSYWPEIWDKNQRVANPHLIYPGDILHFGYHKSRSAGNVEKLVPRIRVERTGNTQGQALSTLAPFLHWPRVVDDYEIKHSPYLLASRDDRTLITNGDRVYIRNLKKAAVGERYAIYHPRKPLYDPHTKAILGHQVDYVGYAKIDRFDQLTTATVLDTKDAIRKGDRLLTHTNPYQTLRAPIQIPRHKVRGEIISLYDAEYLGAACMVIVINKGRADQIKPGHTLGVYSNGKVVTDINRLEQSKGFLRQKQRTQLPPEKVAEAIIYNVSDKLSYGLIVNSEREVKNGDKIGNP